MSIQTVEIALPTGIDSVSIGLAEPIAIVEVRQGPAGADGGGTWDSLTGTASFIPFTVTTAPTYAEGRVYYDESDHSLTYLTDEPEVAMNIGREMWIRVRNNSGATIANGKVVYLSGAIGQTPTIALARADALATSRVIGIATHDVENNSFGYVTTVGEVKGLNTSAFTDGQVLFLSAVTAGEFVTAAPTAPNRIIQVATVVHAHPSQGKLYCHPETDSIDSTGIADSTATGRALVTASTAAAAATAIGVGITDSPTFAAINVTGAATTGRLTATAVSSDTNLITSSAGTTINGPLTLTGSTGDTLSANYNNTISLASTTGVTIAGGPLSITQTWSTTATYKAIDVNVTDSGPSNAASLLMDLRVGGASKLSIRKDGRIFGDGANPFINLSTAVGSQIGYGNAVINNGGNNFTFSVSGTELFRVNNNRYCSLSDTGSFSWSSTSASSGTLDLLLVRDAAGTLAQRNGTAAQESRIYGTYTDTSNYRRLALKMSSAGVAQIVAEGLGSGAGSNRLEFVAGGFTRMTVAADGVVDISTLRAGTVNMANWWELRQQISGGAFLGSGHRIAWGSSTTNVTASADTALSRGTAGQVLIGTGAVGSFEGSLKLTNLEAVGSIKASQPIIFPSYTVGTLPTGASYTGGMAYVTDEADGPTMAFYDGTNWRRVQDRAIVSAAP